MKKNNALQNDSVRDTLLIVGITALIAVLALLA
jgi:hypothetical protein